MSDKMQQWLTKQAHSIVEMLEYYLEPILLLDMEGKFLYANSSCEKLLGPYEEMSSLSILDEANRYFLPGETKYKEQIETILHIKGKNIPIRMTAKPLLVNSEVKGRFITIKQLEKMDKVDIITGLPNRDQFIQVLNTALNLGKDNSIAILFIDIDRFKRINDTLGYLTGDRALAQIASRLNRCKGNSDFLARMGSDEFMMLLGDVQSNEEINKICNTILDVMRDPFEIDGFEFTLTTSIGISVYPNNGKDPATLIKCADIAMYRAKVQGKDRFELFSTEMNLEIFEWFRVENGLRKAIEREEFELYFQPQFRTKNKELTGVEVLVRWKHPNLGIVSPGKFISIAEETGLIDAIGEWVLYQSCKQMKDWIDKGFPKVPISVNLSLRQFMQKNIVQLIESVLKETGLPPKYLDLEITESFTIDFNRTLKVLHQLKSLGVKLSLDDFGTGYSSLQYLSELPIDELKIDQSFVHHIGQSNKKNAIINMIIHMGHALGMEVIAEGVESKEQLLYLEEVGCDIVQGFYYSRPLTVRQYEEACINNFINRGDMEP